MRVGIIGFLQESNTFLREPTTLDHFRRETLIEGEGIRERFADAHHEIGGFFAGLDEAGIEAVPIFVARAMPYGVITAEAFSQLLEQMFAALGRAGALDGLLVAPHGATVAASAPDADGEWLTQLRQRVGPQMPIIGTLDLHANLSPAMVSACNALIAYRSNPHLDQRARGLDAARLLVRTLRGEVQPTMVAAFPPLAVNIERQLTQSGPCQWLYEQADEMLREPGVLSNSILLGFPYADVPEMGSSLIVVTDNDRDQASRYADRLARLWWERRAEFLGDLISIEDAVRESAYLLGPTCLLDMGDNIGGGSPGDGTMIAHELIKQGVGASFVAIHDAEVVQQAKQAGEGTFLRVRVGGKNDDLHGPPLEVEVQVMGIHDGKFRESEARHGGIVEFDMGLIAILETPSHMTIMVTTERTVPFSLKQLTTFGIQPETYRVLVAKGVHAPVAAYAPVSKTMMRVNTPGVTSADLESLTYHKRRHPMYPFERDMELTVIPLSAGG